MTRKDRRETVAEHNDPINYVCGHCRRVNEFDSEKPYECPHCNYCVPRKVGDV